MSDEESPVERSRRFDDHLRSASLRRALAGDRETGDDVDRGMRVHFLDVGQGQSTLVETPEDETLLYDGGPPTGYGEPTGTYAGETVLAALDRLGVDRVDHVVVSHYDADHVGGLTPVVNRAADDSTDLSVGQVYAPDRDLVEPKATGPVDDMLDALDSADRSIRGVSAGDEIDLAGTTTTVLNPWDWDGMEDGEQNERSVVLHVDDAASEGTALLTGDLSGTAETKVAANYPGLLATVDALDAPHHGSAQSSNAFVEVCAPDVLMFSQDQDAKPGHPHDQILTAAAEAGVPLMLATGVHETASIAFGRDRGPRVVPTVDEVGMTPQALQQSIRPEGWQGKMIDAEVAASLEAGSAPQPTGVDDGTRLVNALASGAVAGDHLEPAEAARAAGSGSLAAAFAGVAAEAATEAGLDEALVDAGVDPEDPAFDAVFPGLFEAAREREALDGLFAALPGEDRRPDSGVTTEVAETVRSASEDGSLDRLVTGELAEAFEATPTTALAEQLFAAAADGTLDDTLDGVDGDGSGPRSADEGRGVA